MSENSGEQAGRHAAPDDDPDTDPAPTSGPGGEHAGEAESDDAPGAGTETAQPGADPDDEDEIAQDRTERLDPENRPDNVEVDNTDKDFDAEKGMFTDTDGYDAADPRFPEPGSADDEG